MEAGRLLREKRHLTRLLVLRELHANPRTTLREVGDRLGVTVQAVSNYVRALSAEGLVHAGGDAYPLTPAGVQHLVEGLTEVKRAVDDAVAPLTRIEAASAIAQTPVRAGDRVQLFMVDGDLAARPGTQNGESSGRAVTDAGTGEEVIVRDLEGVVDLEPGRIVVVEVPSPIEGGGRMVDADAFTDWLDSEGVHWDRVAAEGTGAKVLARRAGLPLHVEFAAPVAAFQAAEVGLDVLLLASGDLLKDALARLDARNRETIRRVPVDVLSDPPKAARGRAP